MTELANGLVGSVDQILTASPIDDGTNAPFKWEIDLSNLDGIIATAKHGPHTYNVTIDKVKVSVRTDTHEEIEAAAKAPVTKAPTVKPSVSVSTEEKKALEDAKTVAALAPDTKTKKEAEKLVKTYKK